MIDLFIAHSWRFHPEWVEIADIIENDFPDSVRNFSLPWHDPAISPNSEYGRNFLQNQLKSQIIPANYTVLIDSLFKVESNLRWLRMCVDYSVSEKKFFVVIGESSNIQQIITELPKAIDLITISEFRNWISKLLS